MVVHNLVWSQDHRLEKSQRVALYIEKEVKIKGEQGQLGSEAKTSEGPDEENSDASNGVTLTLEEGTQIFMHAKDKRMHRIIERMNVECFEPTWWAQSAYLQLGLLGFWQARHLLRNAFERTTLKCVDGGEVAIDRLLEPAGQELPDNAPIVLFLHTITGGRYDTTEFMRYALSRGWRPFLLLRRGHLGSVLKNPKFNYLGCTDDTKLMVDHVAEAWPEARFIGAIGLSAGSEQILTYISRQPGHGPVQAAVSACPPYRARECTTNLRMYNPIMEKLLLTSIKLFFLLPNYSLLKDVVGFDRALKASTALEFVEAAHALAGFDNIEDFLAHTDPVPICHNNKIPCLILNAEDDPICLSQNIKYDPLASLENYALIVTKRGSHISFREGAMGQSSYMQRKSLDFLEASMIEADLESKSYDY